MNHPECVVILHNIRSVHNVGSIFRSGDGAGISKIILSGFTPGPIDHKGRARQDFAKVALGAEVPWERTEAPLTEMLAGLRAEGYELLALECDVRARDIFSYVPKDKFVLLLGAEVDSVPEDARVLCDSILSIPMRGTKSSLNVSVATGIALYALLKN